MRHWIYSESLSLLYIRRDYYSHTTGNKKRNDSKFTVLIILRPTTKMRKGIRETTAAHRWDLRVIVKRAHHLTPHRLHFRLPITRTCLNRVQTDIQFDGSAADICQSVCVISLPLPTTKPNDSQSPLTIV